MKKILLLILITTFCVKTFSEGIRVLENNDTEPTTVINFVVPSGQQIPLYRPLGSMNVDQGSNQLIINQFEVIGSAPLSLEVDNGFYTFQLYKGFPNVTFEVDAQGGNQTWELKPKSKYNNVMFWTATGSFMGSFLTTFMFVNYWDKGDHFYDQTEYDLLLAGTIGFSTTAVVSGIMWLLGRPKAKLLK